MTDEYIRKADVVEVINKDADNLEQNGAIPYAQGARAMAIVVDQMLPADVVPVVHSQWKYKCGEVQCPECGNRIHRIDLSGFLNFCPNCGVKMDGGKK